MNRSKSGVCKLIAEMKASGEIAPGGSTRDATVSAPPPDEGGGQDTLGRLRWVRDLLETQLRDAVPAQASRLAKEYRVTLGEIDRLEAREAGDDDPIDKLAGALSSVMRGAKVP